MHKYTNTSVAVMRWQRVPGVTFIILPLPSLPPSAKVQIMIIATFTIAKIEINRSRNNCIQKSALLPCICIYLAKYPYPYISFHIHIYPYLYMLVMLLVVLVQVVHVLVLVMLMVRVVMVEMVQVCRRVARYEPPGRPPLLQCTRMHQRHHC